LAELLGALSLATDLAHQMPPETALKDALLSVAFARHLGLTGQELSDVYYLALLYNVGCLGAAEEVGRISGGDDGSLRRAFAEADYLDRPRMFGLAVTELANHSGPLDRVRAVAAFMSAGSETNVTTHVACCEAAARLAERLGAGRDVGRALNEVFARWDGKVFPRPAGDGLSLISRLTHLVRVAHVHSIRLGIAGAAGVIRKRRAGELDPVLTDVFLEVYTDLFATIGEGSVWDQALEAEPQPNRLVPQSHLAGLTLAIADFTDIKSTFTLGHSRRVGALAEAAGDCLAMEVGDRQLLRLAGHVHDLGSVSIPQRVFTKAGPLNRPERESVRLHPYHTERILSAARSLQPLGALAGLHHERLDGSGYHRGAGAAAQSQPARVLAAAEVYHSLLEERSWRPGFSAQRSAELLSEEAASGALDRAAVRAVLEAAGQPIARRRIAWPSDLTDREVDVIRQLASGRSTRAIASSLSVSEATVHTHTVSIYSKTGVHTRAGIALYAIEHELLLAPKINRTVEVDATHSS
jgi:HD-GYP domain-containing protein (c-di-GMP phosphodiesterase class II)/DNA-binding CsgD family transcriptional regulator